MNTGKIRLSDPLARDKGSSHQLYPRDYSIALSFSIFERTRARLFHHYPLITPGWARTFLTNWENSCAKAQRELGYEPALLSVGMERTIQWLRNKALV